MEVGEHPNQKTEKRKEKERKRERESEGEADVMPPQPATKLMACSQSSRVLALNRLWS